MRFANAIVLDRVRRLRFAIATGFAKFNNSNFNLFAGLMNGLPLKTARKAKVNRLNMENSVDFAKDQFALRCRFLLRIFAIVLWDSRTFSKRSCKYFRECLLGSRVRNAQLFLRRRKYLLAIDWQKFYLHSSLHHMV